MINEHKKGFKAKKYSSKSKPVAEPSKPRNFVAKNAPLTGAGAHKDKKKEMKHGIAKHKKPIEIAEADAPARKPRYKWQPGPNIRDFGHPGWDWDKKEDPNGDLEQKRTAWYQTDKKKEYDAAYKAHTAAQKAAMAKHAGVSEKDFDAVIDDWPNPHFNPNGPDDEDDPNYEPETISVGVDYEYEYHGKYYPATWGYHGGSPEEFPELEVNIHRVVDLDNGEDVTKLVDLDEIQEWLEENEIPGWDEGGDDDYDDYDRDRDYYEENRKRVKRLPESNNYDKLLSVKLKVSLLKESIKEIKKKNK